MKKNCIQTGLAENQRNDTMGIIFQSKDFHCYVHYVKVRLGQKMQNVCNFIFTKCKSVSNKPCEGGRLSPGGACLCAREDYLPSGY